MAKKLKTEDGEMVGVGDWICFKNDVEMQGKIIQIAGNFLHIEWTDDQENKHCTPKRSSDCWTEG